MPALGKEGTHMNLIYRIATNRKVFYPHHGAEWLHQFYRDLGLNLDIKEVDECLDLWGATDDVVWLISPIVERVECLEDIPWLSLVSQAVLNLAERIGLKRRQYGEREADHDAAKLYRALELAVRKKLYDEEDEN